jgi:hypothetical protein
MQKIASVIRCPAVLRFSAASNISDFVSHRAFGASSDHPSGSASGGPADRCAGDSSRRRAGPCPTIGLAAAGLALAIGIAASPATAQVLVKDLQPVSMQLRSAAQDGVRAHQTQVRARQVRVRRAKNQAELPRIANGLTMSDDRNSIPLRLREAPPAASGLRGLKMIAPSTEGVINSFIRGNLHTDADNGTASALSTTDLTVGSDYRVSEDLMFGLAAGRLYTAGALGTTFSAYVTLQPHDRFFLDMSLSYGMHRTRGEAAYAGGLADAGAEGISRSFSMSLNHPRQIGEWYWSPYSRYDRIVTDVESSAQSTSALPVSYGLSALSLGTTGATTWTTPFGAVHPMVMLELQKEVITVAGIGTTSSLTQGVVGFGLTTQVSRDVSAFAESRYESELGATLDGQMMLGMKLSF